MERFSMGKIDDDSMEDMFGALREDRRIQNAERLRQARASDLPGWTKHTEYHWSRILKGLRLNWWPSTQKWSYGTQGNRPHLHFGTQGDLLIFINERERSEESNVP
jgi:hypothetical protein